MSTPSPEPRRNARMIWGFTLGAVLLIIGGVVAFVLDTLRDRVTHEHFERIKVGMTAKEVDAIFRRPADWQFEVLFSSFRSHKTINFWLAERLTISVNIDE